MKETSSSLPTTDPERWTSRSPGPAAEDGFGTALRFAADATTRPRSARPPLPVAPAWLRDGSRGQHRPRRRLLFLALATALGGGSVWATYARWRPPPPRSLDATTVPATAGASPSLPATSQGWSMAPSTDDAGTPAAGKTGRELRNRGRAEVIRPRAQSEATLIGSALQRLRRNNDSAGALRDLDEYRRRFPAGALRVEAELARAEVLVRLKRGQDAARVLDGVPPESAAAARRRLGLEQPPSD